MQSRDPESVRLSSFRIGRGTVARASKVSPRSVGGRIPFQLAVILMGTGSSLAIDGCGGKETTDTVHSSGTGGAHGDASQAEASVGSGQKMLRGIRPTPPSALS
jgi:hypothetical protein